MQSVEQQLPCTDPGSGLGALHWGQRQTSSVPPAVVGKAFRAQAHSRHLIYRAALALTTSSEVGAGIRSHFIDGQGEAQQG